MATNPHIYVSNAHGTNTGATNPIVSDMNADMQTAINTSASLAGYSPYYDNEGNAI